LELFGSPASRVASTDNDVDLLVAFEEPSTISERNFGLHHYIEDTLECEVDLLIITTINSLKTHISVVKYWRKRLPAIKDETYKHLYDIKEDTLAVSRFVDGRGDELLKSDPTATPRLSWDKDQ